MVYNEQTNAYVDDVLTSDDFFAKSYNGIIFHYSLEFYYLDEIEDGRRGKLAWFEPNFTGWDDTNVAVGAVYTAASFVCETLGNATTGAKGHFEDSLGTALTVGNGNDLPEVAG